MTEQEILVKIDEKIDQIDIGRRKLHDLKVKLFAIKGKINRGGKLNDNDHELLIVNKIEQRKT